MFGGYLILPGDVVLVHILFETNTLPEGALRIEVLVNAEIPTAGPTFTEFNTASESGQQSVWDLG
jgi:hypothetical protein